MEQLIEHYAVFGGIESHITLGFQDALFASIETNILHHYQTFRDRHFFASSRLNERRMLQAVAASDAITINVFRRSALSRIRGFDTYRRLNRMGLLRKDRARVAPHASCPHHPRMPIEDKIRFQYPFYRFWYTFIEPHRATIEQGDYQPFFKSLHQGFDRFVSLTFEELSRALTKEIFQSHDPIIEEGGYWDHDNEFDLLAQTQNQRIIIGECKWKGRKICKSELSKLKAKCCRSGIEADFFILFSKSGFSKELLNVTDTRLLCLDLNDFERLL